jgi:hypothetical protein
MNSIAFGYTIEVIFAIFVEKRRSSHTSFLSGI